MARELLNETLRHLSWWRVLLMVAVAYVAIILVGRVLIDVGVPFWVRAIFYALGPMLGVVAGSWLYPKRR